MLGVSARHSIQGNGYYPVAVSFVVLSVFTVIFFVTAVKVHERTMQRRL